MTLIQSPIERSQAAYARSYDRMARDVLYKVGDQVLKLPHQSHSSVNKWQFHTLPYGSTGVSNSMHHPPH
uniref:Uncharacterized protein n=1 Tax=Romanomermis culicivorax TaxID=13658 RepID=A0A915HR63_ROMCU